MCTQSIGESEEANLIFFLRVGNAIVGVKFCEGKEKIFTLKQTHSNKVYVFEKLTNGEVEGDAIITQLKGVRIGVKTADCAPIALLGHFTVGVIHAGWKGLKEGIIEEAVEVFKSFEPLKNVVAFVGPSAKACCYQVEAWFKDLFSYIHYKSGSFFLDIQEEAVLRLKKSGIHKFVKLNVCTICNAKYPSYRRDKSKDRIITYVYIK
ncbi:MAG: laccase domain-containing protein [Hydrogenobacter sp.]|uniref:polyphenol oxidase family protein n=1 Tax=Hydrogenobacter thermophilus TaxID=940 RepID=UPI0030F680C8